MGSLPLFPIHLLGAWLLLCQAYPGWGAEAPFWSVKVRNVAQCRALCWKTPLCLSAIYGRATHLCSLHSAVKTLDNVAAKYPSIELLQVKDAAPQTGLIGCRVQPCQPGYVCQLVRSGAADVCLQLSRCQQPPSLADGSVSFNDTVFTSVAVYTCVEGYVFRGTSATARCLLDGLWHGFSGSCNVIDCGSPPQNSSASWVVSYNATVYGSSATYSCADGFLSASGDVTVKCGASGLWEMFTHVCLPVDCSAPPAVANATAVFNSTGFLATVTYQCAFGLLFEGASNASQCYGNGSWTGFDGYCKEVWCPHVIGVKNGNLSYVDSSTAYGARLNISCDWCYAPPAGSGAQRLCGSNGNWSGGPIACEVEPIPVCPTDQSYVFNATLNLCFKVNKTSLTAEEARRECQQRCGDLLTVDSLDKQLFINTYLLGTGIANIFIGGTDSVSEGTWLWPNGTQMNITSLFFSSVEPNNMIGPHTSPQGEDCLILNMDAIKSDGIGHNWNDFSCTASLPFICELPITLG